jgi:hypothetical protein
VLGFTPTLGQVRVATIVPMILLVDNEKPILARINK